jgi:hypothetical protein
MARPALSLRARLSSGTEIDLRQVARNPRQRQQARVHDPKPQRRHVGDREHAEVAARQLRQGLEVAQALVAPRRMGVMVGVALQVEQHQVRHQVVRIP